MAETQTEVDIKSVILDDQGNDKKGVSGGDVTAVPTEWTINTAPIPNEKHPNDPVAAVMSNPNDDMDPKINLLTGAPEWLSRVGNTAHDAALEAKGASRTEPFVSKEKRFPDVNGIQRWLLHVIQGNHPKSS